ncbi:MAG: 4-hydroxy-tetrahydrodipicolinate synthase [Actinobacteria bacterium]|nr:4-hydroxy-tetrahydrodipicolinate synthase [Actinomycetota bacterium]
MPRFGQVVTAMVTPFHKDGSLNLDGAKRLARWLQDNGNDGLVLAGTTGEAPVLTDDERLSLFKAVVESVTIPVIAGTGTNDTAHSIHMTKEASKLGVAGILAVTPYYNRPSQAGIEAHMRAVCGATDLPVVIYDIPVRTGRKINTPTLAKLANEVKNVAGVKDAAGNPAESARLMTMVPKSFELISGDDGLTLPLMAVGCTAVIGVVTKWNAGDTAGARAVNARLVESFAFETGDDNPNPLPTKAMMNHLGLDVGEARLPMGPPPAGLSERAAHVMKNLVAARG